MTTAELPRFEPLRENIECDVCIVGAGIAGMTTAYLLSRAGKRVVVLDDGPIGGGETGRTTAHLTFALDDFYSEIEKMHGAEGARIAAESHMAAVSRIESIVREEKIECGFQRLDAYWFAENAAGAQDLDEEADAARRAGIPGVSRMDQVPGVAFKTAAALCFPDQAQFHPLRYLSGLARAITRDGGRIFCGSHVAELENRASRPSVKTSDDKTVTSRERSLRGFSPAGRSPAVRAAWIRATSSNGWRWTTTAGVPVPGELSIPLNDEARVEASNEIEWRRKGVVLESFAQRRLASFGAHVFYDDANRQLANAVTTGRRSDVYWTAVAGAWKSGAVTRGQWSLETEYLPSPFIGIGGRVEDRAADGARRAFLPYVNAHFPGTTYTVRLTIERRFQRGRDATFVELGTVF